MKTSKELMKQANIQPKLRLGTKKEKGGVLPNGSHRVKMIADKVITGTDPKTGKPVEYVRYLLEEGGETKTYQTKKLNEKGELSYLVQRLSEINEGQEVILEMKKQGVKNYIEVTPITGGESVEVEDDEEHDEEITNYDDYIKEQ
jgi:hypothetical protein